MLEKAEPNKPELSLVVPCYNEGLTIGTTMPPLAAAFMNAGVDLEMILVDNGSSDNTSEVIDSLIARGLPIQKGIVRVNRGYGLGVLTGLRMARGKSVGFICADGQVGPKEALEVYQLLQTAPGPALAKARRRFRKDSLTRKVVSVF